MPFGPLECAVGSARWERATSQGRLQPGSSAPLLLACSCTAQPQAACHLGSVQVCTNMPVISDFKQNVPSMMPRGLREALIKIGTILVCTFNQPDLFYRESSSCSWRVGTRSVYLATRVRQFVRPDARSNLAETRRHQIGARAYTSSSRRSMASAALMLRIRSSTK